MRRIGTGAAIVLLAAGVGLAGAAPSPASPSAAPSAAAGPTCAGKRATIVDPSRRGDRIVGTRGPDVIVAGRGRGSDVVLGLGGDDLVCGNVRTRVRGGRGSDTFHGVGAAWGDRGADTYWAPIGTGSFDGGRGADLVEFYEGYLAGATSGVYVNLALGLASAETSVGSLRLRTSLAGVEQVRGTPDDDLLLGDGFDNLIRGGGGNDVVNGKGGYDTAAGGPGKDSCSAEVEQGCER
ncbi:hypothetical protein [Nocardioides daeguensis]|uniref:Calcium-binding protein n=1 Tax=Nocardioides daeguensis TaxID=908359 RepID=A0ABP6VGG3_9ACTN|nr:hypothetical protein [Nocardioides daeguensis]MBV6728944.1 hypothetical protein [Nocardioides daeguensis]MCR1773465.1 hypothetical protein [Nocardioides daeguensis]